MNKRALLNAVVRNIMTKRAAQETKGSTKTQAKPAAKPEPELDPQLGDYHGLTRRGGILDLIEDKYGVRPYLKVNDRNKDFMHYFAPDGRSITAEYVSDKYKPSFRASLRQDIADDAGTYLYPGFSRNRKAFQEAAKRFGQYRQLQQQNQGTLKNSLQFAPWAHDNAPQVYRKLMNAPKKNRDKALQILKWQVNNRRNKGNGYV